MQLLALYAGFKVLERRTVAGVIFSEPGNCFLSRRQLFQDFSLSKASLRGSNTIQCLFPNRMVFVFGRVKPILFVFS